MLFIIIFAIVILAVILKGMFGKGESYSKTAPSARVALAFGLTTYLYISTRSLAITGVAFLLSILITQIRIESTKAKPIFMVLSAAVGILVVAIIYQIILLKPYIISFLQNIF